MVRRTNHPLATIYPHTDVACEQENLNGPPSPFPLPASAHGKPVRGLQVDDVPLVEFILRHDQ